MTESGKTTLAKKLAATYRARGIKVLVLDPLADPDWPADYQTSDPVAFLDVVFNRARGCAIFVDESGSAIGRYAPEMERLATMARHWGHSSHFITQRATQISRTVRDQCRYLFAFCVSKEDGDTLARDFGYDELRECKSLPQGMCYRVKRFGGPPLKLSAFG